MDWEERPLFEILDFVSDQAITMVWYQMPPY